LRLGVIAHDHDVQTAAEGQVRVDRQRVDDHLLSSAPSRRAVVRYYRSVDAVGVIGLPQGLLIAVPLRARSATSNDASMRTWG